ncbi:hypothetical protein GCM10009100_09700 [Thalassospira tepidiphila]
MRGEPTLTDLHLTRITRVLFVGRVILTLIIIALLARLTLRWAPERAQLATESPD